MLPTRKRKFKRMSPIQIIAQAFIGSGQQFSSSTSHNRLQILTVSLLKSNLRYTLRKNFACIQSQKRTNWISFKEWKFRKTEIDPRRLYDSLIGKRKPFLHLVIHSDSLWSLPSKAQWNILACVNWSPFWHWLPNFQYLAVRDWMTSRNGLVNLVK